MFLEKAKKTHYINSTEKFAMLSFKKTLNELINEADTTQRDIVILCIGTDRSTGDSLGPLIGYKLSKLPLISGTSIYGTLSQPVHALNLSASINRIYYERRNPFIIAIDACLGSYTSINHITLGKGSLKPGAAVKKQLPSVGDIYITGVVNVCGVMENLTLQSTRLNTVMNMADIITNGVWSCLYNQKRSEQSIDTM